MKLIYIYFLVILLMTSSSLIKSQITDQQRILADEVVQIGLINYLEKIPKGHEQYYGFSTREEFQDVEFGQPLNIIIINYDSIKIDDKAISRSTLWYIPLVINNEYRCFLHVRQIQNSFKVIGIGYMEVAKELDNFEIQFHLKQQENKELLFDPVSNIMCLITDNSNYYPIRPLPNCKDCLNDSKEMLQKAEFLNVIRNNE